MATAVMIPLEPVTSSRLAAIGYDEDTFTLAVRFPPSKKSPAGKVYHYGNISEEMYDDLKHAESIGVYFGQNILNNTEKYPFVCVDEGTGNTDLESASAPVAESLPTLIPTAAPEVIIPDDEAGLKALALSTRSEATMLSISTADECESASREVLRIRSERKLAIEKINRIKEPATAAWKAACALFNEVDSRYAEAESFLDQGILSYRAKERKRIADENAALLRKQQEEQAAAIRTQQEEYSRQQAEAQREADEKAAELAKSDAKQAEAQGAPAEVVQQIIDNPLPVTVRHVAPPPLQFASIPAPLAQQNIPQVAGLSFKTEWFYQITDESRIPLSHEFYTLDPSKINAKVQSLKRHANIPGVLVDSREVPIKRTPGKK